MNYVALALGLGVILFVLVVVLRLYFWNRTNCPPLMSRPVIGGEYVVYDKAFQAFPQMKMTDRINGLTLPVGKWSNLIVPPLNDNNEFTLSFWIRIENQFDGQQMTTTILSRGTAFSIAYNSYKNDLVVRVSTVLQPMIPSSSNVQEFHLPGALRLQTWNSVIVSLHNRNLDIYINGALTNSFLLLNVPNLPTMDTWYLFRDPNMFYGILSSIRYLNYSVDEHTALKLYRSQRSRGAFPVQPWTWWLWRNPGAFEKLIMY